MASSASRPANQSQAESTLGGVGEHFEPAHDRRGSGAKAPALDLEVYRKRETRRSRRQPPARTSQVSYGLDREFRKNPEDY